MEFHVIKLGSRPLLAVPAEVPKLRRAAIGCYPAHTWKKRLVRVVLRALARLGLLGRVFPAQELSLSGLDKIDFEAWMELLGEQIGVAELCPVLVWPADPWRGRVYVYLLNKKGEKLGFCKLGLDARNNALIERERQALGLLQSMQLKLSRIPKLLVSGDLDGEIEGGAYLVVETTPENTRVTDWQSDPFIDKNIAEYAGPSRFLARAEVESLRWWPDVRRRFVDHTAFSHEVDATVDQGIEVCLAHGDLNCTNVLRSGEEGRDEVWLLDWEQSDDDAPCLTDEVCVTVDRLWHANPQDPAGNLRQFIDTFAEHDDETTHANLIMALAYLGTAGFPPAIAMIDAMYAEGS